VFKERFLRVKDYCSAILEIGISRNGTESFTNVLLENKNKETVYIGIDIDDKNYLNDVDKNVYTIRNSSSNIHENINFINDIFDKCNVQRRQFDFIFIDGWHSINQCLIDWEYTSILGENGIVGLHDTAYHPGPKAFMKAISRNIWTVEDNVIETKDDWGIGFAWKKHNSNWNAVPRGYEWQVESPTPDVIERAR
jgi:predicted O-methyltransferase YrrM